MLRILKSRLVLLAIAFAGTFAAAPSTSIAADQICHGPCYTADGQWDGDWNCPDNWSCSYFLVGNNVWVGCVSPTGSYAYFQVQ